MPTEVQKRLRELRRRFNIPQRELAAAVGLSTAQISNYELASPPSPSRFEQLQEAINQLAERRIDRPDLQVSTNTMSKTGWEK